MRRTIYTQLLKWKSAPNRKPLILYGARQVGKTYILKHFGLHEFENLAYINCYMNPAVKTLFSEDKDIRRIILGLSALSSTEIKPGKTLIFLDEVQDIPEVVASLKYFCEEAPDYYVVVAGSLLGVLNMHDYPFPTGKVEILHMFPMTFMEFLDALGEIEKRKLLEKADQEQTVNALLPQYTELLRQYYFVGGMPEAVAEFVASKNPDSVRKIQMDILLAYEADIAKHAGTDTQKARLIFQSIPSQLAKENKKFKFNILKKGARASDYENAIQWLIDAGLVYKVCRLSKVAMPLSFYCQKDVFKLFLLDIGLLGAMAQVPAALMLIGNNVFSEFKGAFTENYVLTQMTARQGLVIGYYAKDNSSLEIDFVVQSQSSILPIEVKAEVNVKSKSLRQFVTVDAGDANFRGYRFSMRGYQHQDWVVNIPLFAVDAYINSID